MVGCLELVVLPDGVAPGLAARTAAAKNTERRSHVPDLAARPQCKRLTLEDMRPLFHLNLKDAAAELDVCPTTLKRTCRRHGIRNWPRKALADAKAQRLSAEALAQGPSRLVRRTPRTTTSHAWTSARSDGSNFPTVSSNPDAGGRPLKRLTTELRKPGSSRDSGTSAPDVTAEDSSSVGGGPGESSVVWLHQLGGSSISPPYLQPSNAAGRLHAPPQGTSSMNQPVKSSRPAVSVHALPARANPSILPLSHGQGGWLVNAGRYAGPMALYYPLALGVAPQPAATAATAGSYSSTGICSSSSSATLHTHPSMWPTQGATSPAWAVQGATSPAWAIQGTPSAGLAGSVSPSAVFVQQLLPPGPSVIPTLPGSIPCWQVVPQQVAGMPRPNRGSGAVGQAVADPEQTVHSESCFSTPWESANAPRPLAPNVEVPAWGRDSGTSLLAKHLVSPPPSDLDFLDDFLSESSACMTTSHALGNSLTSQAMVNGERTANSDDALLRFAEYEGLGELHEHWPSPMGYSAVFP